MVARLKTLGNDLVPKAASPVAQQRFYPNLSSSRHYEQTHGGVPHGLNLGISLGQLFKAVQTDLSQIPEHHLYGRVTAVQGMLIEVGGSTQRRRWSETTVTSKGGQKPHCGARSWGFGMDVPYYCLMDHWRGLGSVARPRSRAKNR